MGRRPVRSARGWAWRVGIAAFDPITRFAHFARLACLGADGGRRRTRDRCSSRPISDVTIPVGTAMIMVAATK